MGDVVCTTSFSTGNGISCSFPSSESELDEEVLRSLLNIPVIFSVTVLSEGVGCFGTSSTAITFSTSVETTTSGCFFFSTSSSESEEDELDEDVVCTTSFSTGNGISCSFPSSESELDEEVLRSL